MPRISKFVIRDLVAGCPRHGVCAWVLGLPFLALSSRPERPDLLFRAELWRVGPRSGGIVAPSLRSRNSVIPNLPQAGEARFVRPVRFAGVRYGSQVFPGNANSAPSRGFSGMNLPIGIFSSFEASRKTIVIPSEARNLLFLSSSRVDHTASRSPIPCN